MPVTKRSHQDLQYFLKQAEEFVFQYPTHIFSKELKKQGIRLKDIDLQYKEAMQDAREDNCAVDDGGFVIYDERGNLKFTKEGMKKFTKKSREISKKLISFNLVINTNHTKDVPAEYKDYFDLFIQGFKQ